MTISGTKSKAGRTLPFPSRPGTRRAFTLTELIVALVVMILLLGITGAIYKSSTDAVNQTNASTELYQKAEAIKRQIQQDLAGITKQGYLIISRQDFQNLEEVAGGKVLWDGLTARSDRVVFWRSGQVQSFENSAQVSNFGQVFYSHANIDPTTDASRFGVTPADGTPLNRWALSRMMYLYIPGVAGNDVFSMSFGQFQKGLFDPANPGAFNLNMRGYATPAVFPITIQNANQDYYKVLAEGCGSVKVEFLMPTEDADHSGTINGNENDGFTNWPPDNGNGVLDSNVLLELPVPTSGGIACYSGPNPINPNPDMSLICFTPDTDLWPKALRFTIRLYDRNLTVKSLDDDPTINREHGGLTFQFIVPLPD